MEDIPPEIDPNFEPQPRIRSNTWPLRPKEFSVPSKDADTESNSSPGAPGEGENGENKTHDPMGLKKQSSRRNAWGNLSYADLITKAIQSSLEQRLTLSQIYDWMVQNVPYFKDKGDSNSSAGWKNSIRHNLSLHNRFMRIQNEGTGKSSWWVINPDAKPGKTPRRRSTMSDTKEMVKKRGRVKKKLDQLRSGGHSPTSPGDFQLSPDFRPRASSNASSCGRLTPIPSMEPDLHDSQVPPLSPVSWENMGGNMKYSDGYADQLTETLADAMNLGNELGYVDNLGTIGESMMNGGMGSNSSIPQMMTGYDAFNQCSDYDYNNLPPPPYPSSNVRNSPNVMQQPNNGITTNGNTGNTYINMDSYNAESIMRQDPMMSNSSSFRAINGMSQTRGMSGGSMVASTGYQGNRVISPLARTTTQTVRQPSQPLQSDSLLRAALTQKQVPMTAAQMPTIQISNYPNMNNVSNMQQLLSYGGNTSSQNQQNMPNDLDFNLDYFPTEEGLECDVDQVIRHELSMDGNLDFSFDPSAPGQNVIHSN